MGARRALAEANVYLHAGAAMRTALLAGFYEDPAPERMRELIACLERNLANDLIAEAHVFLEVPGNGARLMAAYAILGHPKVRLIAHGRRTTFRDLFDHANAHLPGQRVIIANADIYFDHTLARLDGFDLSGKIACLSRRDVLDDGSARFFEHPSSQDAWIFQAPVPPIACDFHMGLLGCDNRLAWEARAAGLAAFNPSRSVRIFHLHRSQVRRYTAEQRLSGPALSIAATTLGAPWLSFIVPCTRRVAALRSTLASLATQRHSTCYVVDLSGGEGAGDWVRAHHAGAILVNAPGELPYYAAQSRNRGARAADDDAVLCFLEPGAVVPPGFSERVLAELPANAFMCVLGSTADEDEIALACWKDDFLRAGACDENLADSREAHDDLVRRLRSCGVQEHWRFARAPRDGRGQAPEAPAAEIAFSEKMGYVVARLETGVSSHANIARPIEHIPAPLAGKPFTQVIAYQAAPVEVEFLSAGKLYVLVGTDWYGYLPATRWLRSIGYRESLEALRTTLGTTFEVWSVLGNSGETLVIPTQTMLVAERLWQRA